MNPGSLSLKEKHNNGKKQRNVCELTFFFVILVLVDKAMLKCVLKCSTTAGRTFDNRGHWHCAYCFQICERKNAMTVHLNTHSKVNVSVPLITKERPKNKTGHSRAAPQVPKSSSSSTEAKIECPQCSKAYPHNKALQRHIRDQHTRKMDRQISCLLFCISFFYAQAVDVKKKGIMYFDPMLNSDKNRLEFSEKIR